MRSEIHGGQICFQGSSILLGLIWCVWLLLAARAAEVLPQPTTWRHRTGCWPLEEWAKTSRTSLEARIQLPGKLSSPTAVPCISPLGSFSMSPFLVVNGGHLQKGHVEEISWTWLKLITDLSPFITSPGIWWGTHHVSKIAWWERKPPFSPKSEPVSLDPFPRGFKAQKLPQMPKAKNDLSQPHLNFQAQLEMMLAACCCHATGD